MLDTFLEALYNKVFVNIVVKRSSTDVYIEICSKKGAINHYKESFDTTILSHKLLEFINSFTKESPYFYISFLDIAVEQGALPTCEKNRLGFYKDISALEHKCHDKKWTYFTSKVDLYAMEKRYEKIGIDFIFSPYSLLSHFFEDKISTVLAMYVLVQDSFISLAIFDSGQLLYAQHLDMETISEVEDEILASIDVEEEVDLEIEQSINLEDIDVVEDVMQDLDDFGDIEDLDSIEDIDEFSQDKDLEEELADAAEELEEAEELHENSFNEDYQRFSLIQTALSHFYNNEKYESTFIETVYIADGAGVSSDLKHYLEEEMFLNVYLRRMDISMEVCELAKEELNYVT
ncbi:hypothetical protein JHD47_02910 [Sulfurimonas sp. SAG-AH-194-L11]|nr:hypothetical protein [Sulfurimonas sp. SAG-AH-194-L11]MDF1876762.1 hypothetical protein [Sulfurimonas sp. SAG-AH-194-L11]